jgi:cytochrome oxidase Cu insertion factor (SCO1/SenC/PrrC family)
MRKRALALLVSLLALAVVVSAAQADGDPASDILLSQQLFLPSDTGGSRAQQTGLEAVVAQANRDRYPIRVAIIPDGYDLGSVTALWGKPQIYAQFLGIELSLVYRGPLLVAMPDGFGFNWPGHSSASAYRELGAVRTGAGGAGLLEATQDAVARLAGASGVKLSPPGIAASQAATERATAAAKGTARAAGETGIPIAAIIALVLAVVVAAGLALKVAPGAGRAVRVAVRSRWALPGFALVAITVLAAVAGDLIRLRRANAAPAEAAQSAPFTWAAGQRPAPNFGLVDQNGHPIELSAYRGRPVIVTFVDPLCRNLCPLAAHVLNQADSQLPAAERPVIIAVSVDIYADTRADLLQDFQKWDLVSEWEWAVGRPGQLASVWNRYKIGVSVQTKTIAGTTVHYITHDEVAYVVDPSGYERALLVWPYDSQDVIATVRDASRS